MLTKIQVKTGKLLFRLNVPDQSGSTPGPLSEIRCKCTKAAFAFVSAS